jgi:DNA polymerase-1
MNLKLKSKLDLSGPIAFDCETTGLSVWKADQPFAISFCDVNGTLAYIDFPVDPFTRAVTYRASDLDFIASILSNPDVAKVGHNVKFDVRMVERHVGIPVCGQIHETMLAARAYNSLEPSLKLKPLAHKYLDYPTDDEKDLQRAVVSGRHRAKKLGWNIAAETKADYWIPKALDLQNDLCEKYCRLDSERTMALFLMYMDWMKEEDVYETYLREIELWPIVYRMEERGVRIDTRQAAKELAYNQKRMADNEERMYALAGCAFNENSTQQLADVLYNVRKLEVKRETKQSKASRAAGREHVPRPSTDWKALRYYSDDPFVRALVEYRAATGGVQFFRQYIDLAVDDPLNEGHKALHASFDQAAARTGRFGCKTPNLQNVPTRENPMGAEPPNARGPFGPRPGYLWYAFDFSQMELRVLADFSQDKSLIDAILTGRDIHSEIADAAWGGDTKPAIRAAVNALELQHGEPSRSEVGEVWKVLGWPGGGKLTDAATVARQWLKEFNWSIVKAEKSIGKKTSRGRAKNVVYAQSYGGTYVAVMDMLFCSEEEARAVLNAIDTKFPRCREYAVELARHAEQTGYIRTAYDRKLGVDPLDSFKAVNYNVQGSCADVMKQSMISVSSFLQSTGLDAHIVMTIHDELDIEVRKGHNYMSLLKGIKKRMEDHGGRFGIELPVECSRISKSWDAKSEKLEL